MPVFFVYSYKVWLYKVYIQLYIMNIVVPSLNAVLVRKSGDTMTGPLVIGGGTVTASTPVLDLRQTWNNAAVTFTGLKLNIPTSTFAGASMLLDLQYAGISQFFVNTAGVVEVTGAARVKSNSGYLSLGTSYDVRLERGAANTLDLRNGANAQTFQVFGTYTDSSNYRRLRSTMTTGGAATIAAEGLGTGVSGNQLLFSQNGAQVLGFSTTGNAAFAQSISILATGSFSWTGRNALLAPSDSQYLFSNNSGTDVDIFLKLGVNTSAAAGIKRVGTALQIRLNDDSAFASIQSLYDRVGSGTPEGAVSAPVGTTYHRTDGASGTSLYIKKSGTGNTGWVGTGSFLIRCGAAGTIPRTTTGCGVSSTETATNKVNYDGVDFDSSASEYANFWEYMPADYNGGTITAEFTWTAASGSGTVIFGLQARSYADGDAIDQAFGTAQTTTDTLITATNIHYTPATSAITIAGTPTAGALTCFQVYRDISDTLAVDATIIAIKITYNI